MLSHLIIGALAAATLQQTDTTVAVRPGCSLHFENHQGSVVVRTWDRSELRVRARHDAAARVRIDTEGRPATEVHIEAAPWRRGGVHTIEYELTVPRRFDLNLEGVNLRIDVADVEGEVDAETINGSVTMRGVNGAIRIETLQGRITVSGARGSLHAEGTNQDIEVDGFDGDIDIENVNGAIVLTGITSRQVSAETVNGRVEYRGTLRNDGRYSLSTHNGGVDLWVPEGTNGEVDVATFVGSLDAEFDIQLRQSSRNRASFTIGSGRGARITLTSFGGPIRIRRGR